MIDRLGMTLIVLGFALAVPALAGGGEDFRLVEEWGDGMCCRDRGTVIPPTIPGCGDTIGDCMRSGCATTAYEPPVLEDPYNPLADAHCEDTDKDAKCDARKPYEWNVEQYICDEVDGAGLGCAAGESWCAVVLSGDIAGANYLRCRASDTICP